MPVKCRTAYLNKGNFKNRRNRADPSFRHEERPQATVTTIISLGTSVGSGHEPNAARRQTVQTVSCREIWIWIYSSEGYVYFYMFHRSSCFF